MVGKEAGAANKVAGAERKAANEIDKGAPPGEPPPPRRVNETEKKPRDYFFFFVLKSLISPFCFVLVVLFCFFLLRAGLLPFAGSDPRL